jgi:catechol 2,3-dioxygenase-like lactoylglutathione lyase family enzyme
MEHVGVVVDDLAAAIALFIELGLDLDGRHQSRDGRWTASSASTVSEPTSLSCRRPTATADSN